MGTKLLTDMDAIVAQEFDQYFEIELAKAITGWIAKGGLQYFATNAVRSEDDLAGGCWCWCGDVSSGDDQSRFTIMEHIAQADPVL